MNKTTPKASGDFGVGNEYTDQFGEYCHLKKIKSSNP